MYPVMLLVWAISYPTLPPFIVNTYETESECTEAITHVQANYPLMKLHFECQVET